MLDRERAGREASPTAVVVDARSLGSGGAGVAGTRGYDAAKKVMGRKRHAMVDTDGRLLMITASTAGIHDSHGEVALLGMAHPFCPFVEHCFADKAYTGKRVPTASIITVELVDAAPGQRGFTVQLRRRVIERTFAWIGRCRRLAGDHETTVSSGTAFTTLGAAMILVRRLARELLNGLQDR